jgi:hypothetical protein
VKSLPRPSRLADRITAARVALVCAVVSACVGGLVVGGAATAAPWAPVPETGARGGLLLEHHTGMPGSLAELSPGEPVRWQIRTTVDHHADTVLDLELRKAGALAEAQDGLEITVLSCDDAWLDVEAAPTCPTGADEVTWAAPRHDYRDTSPSFRLADGHGDSEVFLLVEFALPATAAAEESLRGLTATMAVGVTATDTPPSVIGSGADRPSSPLPARLAWTGSSIAGALLLGVAALLLGLAAALARPRREPM